jgi:hypothetical protein
MKHVRDAIAFEHVGKALRPAHFAIVSELHSSLLLSPFFAQLLTQSASLRAKRSNPVGA